MTDFKDFNFKLNEDDFNIPGAKTYIFIPADGKDMRAEYPELNTVEAFANLSNAELVFVWLLANRTSPLCPDNDKDRNKATKKALEWSKLWNLLDNATCMEYGKQRFPNKIVNALNKMAAYNPTQRMKAKMMVEKMFNNLSKMVDVSEEELQKMELGEKKQYADLVKTVTNSLDELIVSNEDAYGIKVIKKKEKAQQNQGQTLMDSILNA